jgi:hypothetical protein
MNEMNCISGDYAVGPICGEEGKSKVNVNPDLNISTDFFAARNDLQAFINIFWIVCRDIT